jgi:hypothetical protein
MIAAQPAADSIELPARERRHRCRLSLALEPLPGVVELAADLTHAADRKAEMAGCVPGAFATRQDLGDATIAA